MNSKQVGNITELETMLCLMKLGYNVLIPYGDCERYDYVIDTGKKFLKIQSKTSSSDDDGRSFKFNCRSCNRQSGNIIHHRYTKDEIDYFVTSFKGKCYLIPVEDCGGGKRLRILPSKNNQTRNTTEAKTYEMEEVVKTWQADE